MDIAREAHQRRQLQRINESRAHVIGFASDTSQTVLSWHSHSRDQFWHALSGLVHVVTEKGHWLVPPEYALWIPAGCEHSVELLGTVQMRSLYLQPGMIPWPSERPRLLSVNAFTQALVVEAIKLEERDTGSRREQMILELLLMEIGALSETPLALPLPSDPKMLQLCKAFLEAPEARTPLDDWAKACRMSRRSLSRHFRDQTGLALDEWRRHACIFVALPRVVRGDSITSIALELGYESPAAFASMFRRLLGRSPRSYVVRAGG